MFGLYWVQISQILLLYTGSIKQDVWVPSPSSSFHFVLWSCLFVCWSLMLLELLSVIRVPSGNPLIKSCSCWSLNHCVHLLTAVSSNSAVFFIGQRLELTLRPGQFHLALQWKEVYILFGFSVSPTRTSSVGHSGHNIMFRHIFRQKMSNPAVCA